LKQSLQWYFPISFAQISEDYDQPHMPPNTDNANRTANTGKLLRYYAPACFHYEVERGKD
jgi:hypothetical protein